MCEADVFIIRHGQEELLMEKVDRVVPGEDGSIFMESVFGERKVVKARIREMELVHHRIIMEEIPEQPVHRNVELWIEPATDHGHFHAGEDVLFKIQAGYNMKAAHHHMDDLRAYLAIDGGEDQKLDIVDHHGNPEVNMGQESDGLLQIYAVQERERVLYAKVMMEIGHHHHHSVAPIGLPLEIVPVKSSHPRMGESYEVQVLKDGKPAGGVEIKATHASTRNPDYPHRMVSDEEGKASVFLTARGNYLFCVESENITSTFTLVKGF